VQHGAPHEVYVEPADAWVAGFLGHRNVLAGDELPSGLRQVLGPLPEAHAIVLPEEAVRLRGTTAAGVAVVVLRGHVREVHRPPARPGVRVEVDGGSLWMALPSHVPVLGGDIDIEVDRTTMRTLPMR
jgi:ABC-type Fe3+/spermidine/putrescine transport system ATPase subunit